MAIRVDYVDLKKVGSFQNLYIGMVTNEGVRRHLQLTAYPRHWSGESEMFGNVRDIRCAVRHSIDYEPDFIRVGFPRRCASNPRWVRFRVGAFVEDDDRLYADDALPDRPLNAEDRNWALSGRLYRQAVS